MSIHKAEWNDGVSNVLQTGRLDAVKTASHAIRRQLARKRWTRLETVSTAQAAFWVCAEGEGGRRQASAPAYL
jgi:hypothetical protein